MPSKMFAQVVREQLTIRVGSYDNSPKIWMDGNGVAQGLFPDILNAIAATEGWKLEYVQGTWDEGLKRLEANEIDIMPDVALSDERKQKYDFNSETVLVNWGMVYTRQGISIASMTDLEGKRIAILKSGIHYNGPLGVKNLIDTFGIKAEIIGVKEYAEVFDLLDKKEADIGVVNMVFGISSEKNYAVKRSNIIFDPAELRFAFTKGAQKNDILIGRIDADLRQMKNDSNSAYHNAIVRHLGGLVERVEVFPSWLRYLISGSFIFFAVVLIYILVLRGIRRRLDSLVKVRTADLEKEKENFKSLFEGSNDSIVILDASSLQILESNGAAWRRIGYPKKEDLIGKNPLDFSAPIQLDGRPSEKALKEFVAKVRREGGAYFDWTCRHVDGSDIFTTVMFTPLDWGGRKVLLASLRNITELRRNEALVEEQKEKKIEALVRFEQLFENVPDAVFVADSETRKLVDCNRNAVKLIGFSKEKILTMTADELHPKDRVEDTMRGFESQVKKEIGIFNTEVLSKNGSRVPVEVNAAQFMSAGKQYLLGVFRDISRRQKAEEQVRALDVLKNKFIQTVSHQLRTPLSAIRWSIDELLGKKVGKLTKAQQDMLRMAYEANIEVVTSIDDLLTAMDIEEGQMRLEKGPAVFEDIARSACLSLEPRYKIKKLKHNHDFPGDQRTMVNIDVARIREVIVRLLDNAIAYTKEGGWITARIFKTDGRVRYEVSDNGVGVPKAEQAHIFSRFSRGSNAVAMKPNGVGLGLYLSKSIIETHGGKIGLTSEEGKGSTFWFELPVAG